MHEIALRVENFNYLFDVDSVHLISVNYDCFQSMVPHKCITSMSQYTSLLLNLPLFPSTGGRLERDSSVVGDGDHI